MSWELLVIASLILTIFGIAVWSMRKNKKAELNLLGNHTTTTVDSDELASKIAREMRQVLQEFLEKFAKVQPMTSSRRGKSTDRNDGFSPIQMDESIIPIDIDIEVESVNLDNATTEKKVVDKGLEKSKSKLAGLFKKKNKE